MQYSFVSCSVSMLSEAQSIDWELDAVCIIKQTSIKTYWEIFFLLILFILLIIEHALTKNREDFKLKWKYLSIHLISINLSCDNTSSNNTWKN